MHLLPERAAFDLFSGQEHLQILRINFRGKKRTAAAKMMIRSKRKNKPSDKGAHRSTVLTVFPIHTYRVVRDFTHSPGDASHSGTKRSGPHGSQQRQNKQTAKSAKRKRKKQRQTNRGREYVELVQTHCLGQQQIQTTQQSAGGADIDSVMIDRLGEKREADQTNREPHTSSLDTFDTGSVRRRR